MKKVDAVNKLLYSILFLCVIGAIGILIVFVPKHLSAKETPQLEQTEVVSNQAEVVSDLKPYSKTLTSGHYVVGLDIPSGTYTLTAKEGNGNVYSTNAYDGGLNEIMGTSGEYVKEFQNAVLPAGEVLSISDVEIKIKSDGADIDGMIERENPAKTQKNLSSGNYTAGIDFDAGAYVITATKGKGNVYSSNSFRGINAIMASEPDDMSIKEFKNVLLEDGDTLTISDVTVRIKPSK